MLVDRAYVPAALVSSAERGQWPFTVPAVAELAESGLRFEHPVTDTMSHGEGFLTVFDAMFRDRGFYVMDEPEAALSFSSCLRLVALMHELGRTGAQVVCATHSPVLAATPGADVLEVGDDGLRRTSWSELGLVDHWRRYLTDPDAYLRHMTSPDE